MPKQITAEVVMKREGKFPGVKGVKDTEGKWWDFPTDKVNFGDGAIIIIEGASGPKKNRVTRFTVKSNGSSGGGGGAAPSGGGKAGPGGDYSEVNWNASVARAVEIVDLLLRHDAVALGAKTAKPADRQAIILDVLDEVTARVFTDIKERKPLKKSAEIAEDLGESDGDDVGGDDDFTDSDDI